MPHITSFDELYSTIGAVVLASTAREWWRKTGIQGQPKQPYATIYLREGRGIENEVVDTIETDEGSAQPYVQIPWGTKQVDCTIEFFRGDALNDANRMSNALKLEARFWDLWELAGLIGTVDVVDVSAVFRADTENRAETRFSMYANIALPEPLDNRIMDINSVVTDVRFVKIDEEHEDSTITTTGG